MPNDNQWSGVIGPHGGYRNLKSYQNAEIVHDATVVFCERFVDRRSRTHDQMVQAARSGKQNIAEGSVASGTSKKTELKLVGVARASLEELLLDYQDFLRQHNLPLWDKSHPKAQQVRKLAYESNRSYSTYKSLIESSTETAANTLICVIHQANYLLDQQLRQLDKQFLAEGGFTEKLYRARSQNR
jgi:four helix bundle suffix protein